MVPANSLISSCMTEMIALLIICLDTTPMPIGLTLGILSRAINLQAVRLLKSFGSTYVVAIFFCYECKICAKVAEGILKGGAYPLPETSISSRWSCAPIQNRPAKSHASGVRHTHLTVMSHSHAYLCQISRLFLILTHCHTHSSLPSRQISHTG